MTDGDTLRSNLSSVYRKPYKWLCEGKATSEECARVLMKALKQDLIKKGNLPVVIAQSMAERLARTISATGKNSSIDYAALSIEFEQLVAQADGVHTLKTLILRAGKNILHDLRYEHEVDVDNVSVVILEQYINEVKESEFKNPILLTSEHYAGVDQVTVSKRIEEIEPNINVCIGKFAKDAMKNQSIAKLSLPRCASRKAIDMNEDLLAS